MKQPLERIRSDVGLPASADVVVIGGGIAGASSAWELSRMGMKVVLFEKGIVGCEQSSRNWGWCRQQGRDPKELELAKLSLDLWPSIAGRLQRDPGFKQCGVTFLTDSEDELADWGEWRRIAVSKGIQSQLLSATEAQRMVPGGSPIQWVGGLTTATDGRAEPSKAAPYMVQAAQALGAHAVEHCAVHDVDITNGRVSAVHTEKGLIRCDAVVVAAGAWTALLLRKLGVVFPQAYVHASVAKTRPVGIDVRDCISTPYFSMRAREDGGFTVAKSGRGTVYLTPSLIRHAASFLPTYLLRRKNIKVRLTSQFWREFKRDGDYLKRGNSPFAAERVLDPDADQELIGRTLRDLGSAFPALRDLEIETAWGGVIDSTPDAVPVISTIPQIAGIVVASGFSGHGFGVGPAVGQVVSCLISGMQPPIDMTPFRYSRMIDGSKLRPYLRF